MEDLSLYNPEGSVLRKAQMRMLEMLDAFVEICDRHHITYWIACGTLLGARRHQGFIPWDDDLDVYVMQKDYKKLSSVLQKELPERFKLQARETDKQYWFFHSKLRDTKSLLYDKMRFVDKGIFVDLFPIYQI
jgi:lipopolysaccharide cholinephosphotransferase